MKSFLSLSIVFSIFLGMSTSCSKDSKIDAHANIKVTEFGTSKSGVSVYMFSDSKGPNTAFFTPFHSDKVVVTEANGVAKFDLQKTFDLNNIDTQTTLYFGVFDNDDNVLGNTAITISKGETKTATISI